VLYDVASSICQGRRLWPGTNITMEPPPSPLGPEELGEEEEGGGGAILRLVPVGATDVRISVFPWALPAAAAAAEATAQPTLILGSGGGGGGGSSDVV